MGKFLIRLGLAVVSALVIGYPLTVWYANVSLTLDQTLLVSLFPAIGLVAFTIMYLHILGRPFKHMLEHYVDFDIFERISSYVVLVAVLLHPALRTVFLLMNDISISFTLPLVLGIIGSLCS